MPQLRIAIISALLVLTPSLAAAQTLTGTVTNLKTGEPIGGASIRVVGTTRGTYTRERGNFRLPLTKGARKLLVRSVGYEEITVEIGTSPMNIALKQSSVGAGGVVVTADIEPEGVILRAIERLEENDARIKSLVSTLYSKMHFKLNTPGVPGFDGANESITETISRIYDRRSPDPKKHVRILQRRQTKNIPASDNLLVFDRFFDFTRPVVKFFQTRLVTPLAPDALDTYSYEFISKKPLGDNWVYEIGFAPSTSFYPGFEGSLSIIEGSYQVIAANFSPTEETSIPFVTDINYTQRYERVQDTLWIPMYQEVTGSAGVAIIAGLMEIDGRLDIETWVTDVEANTVIPDSLLSAPKDSSDTNSVGRTRFRGGGGVRVTVRNRNVETSVEPDADSAKPEFWEEHSFTELSDEEREAYHKADSIAEASPKATSKNESTSIGLISVGDFGMNVVPVLDRTTITGVMGGFELEFLYKRFALTTSAAWGGGGVRAGNVGLNIAILDEDDFELSAFGNVFSKFTTVQEPRTVLGKVNFLNLANLFYASYSDYFRQDGFNAGINASFGRVKTTLVGTSSRHINMPLVESVSREVVLADAGNYQTMQANVSIAKPSFFEEMFSSRDRFFGEIRALVGEETVSKMHFSLIEVSLGAQLQTISTGYNPMRLDVALSGGSILTASAPRQFQFSLLKRFPVIGGHVNAATVAVNAFGGTEYFRAHFEHNFSDVWWRAIGLPTFKNNRGVDIIGIFDGSKFWQRGAPVTPGRTWDATEDWYMEAGFAIGRIPTFVSDLFYLRFDALWPVGGLAPRGSFGWSLTLSSPIL